MDMLAAVAASSKMGLIGCNFIHPIIWITLCTLTPDIADRNISAAISYRQLPLPCQPGLRPCHIIWRQSPVAAAS